MRNRYRWPSSAKPHYEQWHHLFGKHAFRKHQPEQEARSVLNASLWHRYGYRAETLLGTTSTLTMLKDRFSQLLADEEFVYDSYSPNA